MTDIRAIIAAAKRVHHQQPFDKQDAATYIALRDHAIAMSEALARVDDLGEAMHLRDPAYCAGQMAEVARECLGRIVKELMP